MNNERYILPDDSHNLLLDFEQIVINFIECRRLLQLVDLNVININDNVINIMHVSRNAINTINNEWYLNIANNNLRWLPNDAIRNLHCIIRNILTLNNHVHMIYQDDIRVNYHIRRIPIQNLNESVMYLQNYLKNNQNNQNN